MRPGTLLRVEWAHPNVPSFSMFPMLVGLDRRLLVFLYFLCRDAATCSLLPFFFFPVSGKPLLRSHCNHCALGKCWGGYERENGSPLHERDSNVFERKLNRKLLSYRVSRQTLPEGVRRLCSGLEEPGCASWGDAEKT